MTVLGRGRPALGPGRRLREGARTTWRSRWPLLFVSPFFILFGVFELYPFLYSIWLSLVDWKSPTRQVFVGVANFSRLSGDPRFWGSMLNAVIIFFIHVPLMTFLATVLAVILNAGFVRFQGLWRAIIFLPNITSMVAAGYVFKLLLDSRIGVVNSALGVLGASPVPWLDDMWWARISVGLLVLWAWLGFNTLILLAGLQTISPEIGEAAQVDGASRVQTFWRITVPLLRPQIVFVFTLSVLGAFQLYTEPYILTRGGPFAATESPSMQIFDNMFRFMDYGYAAAMSLTFLAIVVVITLIQYRFSSKGGQVA